MRHRRIGALLVVGLFQCLSSLHAGDWPGWRGPTGQGQCEERGLPLSWSAKTGENILWKMPLPGSDGTAKLDQNQSSPIVCRDRVFVTTSYWPAGRTQKEHPEHHVVCFRASDGKVLWDRRVPPGPWLLTDLRGGYTAPTPASDGERVYALFGSAVLAALDFEGTLVWRQEIAPYFYDVAIGNSPLIHGDTILLMCDQIAAKKTSRLLAFDRKTGSIRWEHKRQAADWTHSTPIIVPIKGKPQLLVAGAQALEALDPGSGQRLWWCAGPGGRVGDTPSPVVGAGLVYCDSGRGGPGIAVDPTGEGDVTRTHLRWKIGPVPEGFSSPIMVADYLVRLHGPETVRCWRLATGEELFKERLAGVSTASSPFATPEGRIYLASAGRSFVIQAGPKLDLLATNDLGDPSQASPAVSGGRIFLKGRKHLYCIGKK
jgi:outer membrane protein assembly factor BamB